MGRVAFEQAITSRRPEWTAELNIGDLNLSIVTFKETLTREERLKLAGLTQRMRDQVDSEINLPFKGAQKLHRYLTELGADDTGPDQ